LIGLAMGAAILSKWLPAFIVLAFFFIYNFGKNKIWKLIGKTGLIFFISCLIFLPWQIYTSQNFPNEFWWEQEFNWLHLITGLDGFGKPWWYFIDQARMTWNELIYLAFGWFVWNYYQKRDLNKLSILIWVVIPFLFFSFVATKMQGYVLFVAPAIFIIQSLFIEELLEWYKKSKNLKWINVVLVFVIVLLSIRFSIERVKPFKSFEKPSWALRFEKMESKVEKIEKEFIIINEPNPIEAMFSLYPSKDN